MDALKGLLILLVVVGHSGMGGALPHAGDSFLGGLLMRLIALLPPIYYFHIPLFFSVSAVHGGPATAAKTAKRIFWLVVLFTFWTCWPVIWYFVKAYIDHPLLSFWPFWTGNVRPWLMERLTAVAWGDWSRNGILWFLPALTVFTLLLALGKKIEQSMQSWRARIAVAGLGLLGWFYYISQTAQIAGWHVKGYIPWGIDTAIYLLPVGLLHRWIYQNRTRFAPLSTAALVGGLLLGELLVTAFEPLKTHSPYHYRIDLAQFSVATTPWGIVGFLVLTSSLMLLALRLRPLAGFVWLGRYSLPVYVMHMYFLDCDLVKVLGLDALLPQSLAPGSIEAWHYLGRLVAATLIPISISMLVGSLLPAVRPLGFIAPAAALAGRQRLLARLTRRRAREPAVMEPGP